MVETRAGNSPTCLGTKVVLIPEKSAEVIFGECEGVKRL